MKRIIFAITALFTFPATAGLLTVTDSLTTATCYVANATVNSVGDINVVCTSTIVTSGGATPDPTPSPTPTPPPVSACGTVPPGTSVVDTGSLSSAWPQHTYGSVMPTQIMAFKITVGEGQRGNFTVAETALSTKSKLLVVSQCTGVLTPISGQSRCVVSGTEASMVRLSSKPSEADYYCKLPPGTYYVNAVSKNSVNDSGYNCSTSSGCSFYAVRSAPY